MATLILSRQLYLIASLRSVELPGKEAKRKNLAIELILGLVIPVLVAGPLYYIVQKRRFQVVEGFGCASYEDNSVLGILVIWTWSVIPPLFSIVIYYPTVVRVLYRQNRDVKHVISSDDSITHTNYLRILALANIDILLTLPIGIASVILVVKDTLSSTSLSFYSGWTYVHTEWDPLSASYAELIASGTFTVAEVYFVHWAPVFLSFVIFGLFGISAEARAAYCHAIFTVGCWFGWKPDPSACGLHSMLSTMEFHRDESPQNISPDAESLVRRERIQPEL
ncbi:STE3-domain-containing protein [Peniophora sp. CONT]|nr:STE3-domain-containing protein [Peniophora sp. CONT]